MGKIGGNDRDREKVAKDGRSGSDTMAKGASAAEEPLASIAVLVCVHHPGRGSPKGQKSYP